MGEPLCHTCHEPMQQDLDYQGLLNWFCVNYDCPINRREDVSMKVSETMSEDA